MINRYYNADHFQVNASLACSRDTFIIIRILVLFFFLPIRLCLRFFGLSQLAFGGFDFGVRSIGIEDVNGRYHSWFGATWWRNQGRNEIHHSKRIFSLFLHSNMLTSKSTMLNFTTPSFFTRSLSILWFLKHFFKNNKILSLLFGFFPPEITKWYVIHVW